MTFDTLKRQQILRKIYHIPDDKLDELEEFISKFEIRKYKKNKNLSFAGVWNKLDKSVFTELTDNLINNRKKNTRRNNE